MQVRSVFTSTAASEVLRYEDAPDPELRPGEVLVRVRACALEPPRSLGAARSAARQNSDAAYFRQRRRWRGRRRCRVWRGGRCAGDAAGRRQLRALSGVPVRGVDNECPQYEVLGYRNHQGGYAEFVNVPLQNLVPIPDHIDFVDASAFPADLRNRVAHAGDESANAGVTTMC